MYGLITSYTLLGPNRFIIKVLNLFPCGLQYTPTVQVLCMLTILHIGNITASASPLPSPTVTLGSAHSHSLRRSKLVGLILGGTIGGIATSLCLVLVFLWLRRGRKTRTSFVSLPGQYSYLSSGSQADTHNTLIVNQHPQEVFLPSHNGTLVGRCIPILRLFDTTRCLRRAEAIFGVPQERVHGMTLCVGSLLLHHILKRSRMWSFEPGR